MPKITTEETVYQCDFCHKNKERYEMVEIAYYVPTHLHPFAGGSLDGVQVAYAYLCKHTCADKPIVTSCGFCRSSVQRNPNAKLG